MNSEITPLEGNTNSIFHSITPNSIDESCITYQGSIQVNNESADKWIEAFTEPMEEDVDTSMEHLVQQYFRKVVFKDVKFMNDFVVQHTKYCGPDYEGGMLHKLLKYVGKDHLGVPERVKFWRKYSTVAKKILDRQKSNKTSSIRSIMIKGMCNKFQFIVKHKYETFIIHYLNNSYEEGER